MRGIKRLIGSAMLGFLALWAVNAASAVTGIALKNRRG